MKRDRSMIERARIVAMRSEETTLDPRSYVLGAVGLRRDGLIVVARNVSSSEVMTSHHAEARLCKKLTWASEVWVTRVTRDGHFAMSKPCVYCMNALLARGVKRIVYTTGPNRWEVMKP